MNSPIKVSRRIAAVALVALLLLSGTGLVLAFQGDFTTDVIQVCVESSGKIRVVDAAADCKASEIAGEVVTGSGLQTLLARIVGLETADTAMQAQIAALQSRVGDLEQLDPLVRLLHRNSAAVVDVTQVGGIGSQLTGIIHRLGVCTDAERGGSIACPRSIEVLITANEQGTFITFTDASDPDFAPIIALITNGQDDWVSLQEEFYPPSATVTSGRYESAFFRDFTAPGAVDLAGYSISQITLAVDQMRLYQLGGLNNFDFKGRWFFELAP